MRVKSHYLQNVLKNLIILLFFLLVIIFVNRKTLSSDSLIVSGDGFMYYISKVFFIETVKNGELPLWNPYSSIGTPFLADVQQSALSPFNILYFIFDTPLAFNIFRIIQLVVAGFFMYLYMQEITDNTVISIITGFIFSFSTILGGRRVEHNTIITTVSFFPVIFYFLEKFRHTQHYKWLILSAISMTIQFISGFTQIVLYFNIVSFIYLVDILSEKKVTFKNFVITVSIWISIYLLLSAVQIVPTLCLMLQSGRNNIVWEAFSVLSYDLRILLIMFVPEIFLNHFVAFGDYASSGIDIEIYVGIICLMFAIFEIIYFCKERHVKLLLGIMLGGFIYGMAPNIPILGKIVYSIPLLNSFRVCARSLPIFIFTVLILAGKGMNSVCNIKKLDKFIKLNAIFCIIFVILSLFVNFLFSQDFLQNNFNDYCNSISQSMILALVYCCFNYSACLIIKKLPKKIIIYSVFICIGIVSCLDVSRFSLIYLQHTSDINILLDDGMDIESKKLLYKDKRDGYRSFITMDSPLDFVSSNTLNVSRYGRSMVNNLNIYNSWLTFLDKKLSYWNIKETVYYPNFIKMINANPNLISMLGIHYIFDAWDHKINTEIPCEDDSIILEIDKLELPAVDGISVYSEKADWLEPYTCYKICLNLDGETPSTFYADLYNSNYDNPKQDGHFSNDLKNKITYIYTDELPEEDIYFRIVGTDITNLKISNIRIYKEKMTPIYNKIYFSDSNITIYENVNANKLIYPSKKVASLDRYSENWQKDYLTDIHEVSYIKNINQELTFEDSKVNISQIKETANSIQAIVETDGPTFINHSQLNYPGWNVYIDGKKEQLYTVNNLIQGTFVPAGNHIIQFCFEPVDIKIGGLLTLCGIFEIIILIYLNRRKKFETER